MLSATSSARVTHEKRQFSSSAMSSRFVIFKMLRFHLTLISTGPLDEKANTARASERLRFFCAFPLDGVDKE